MLKPHEIIGESFRMIEAEVGPHHFDATEWPVVRRIIHAAGDLELVNAVAFTNQAAHEGVQALRGGAPIVTDVRMVEAGINKQMLADLNLTTHCYIDAPQIRPMAEAEEQTRSYCAMRQATDDIGTAVYVVGNAPTALFALCERVHQGLVSPQLIIAMPVGFVSVVESKEQALALDVPVITIYGRKGGSAMAAATVNALLALAQQGSEP